MITLTIGLCVVSFAVGYFVRSMGVWTKDMEGEIKNSINFNGNDFNARLTPALDKLKLIEEHLDIEFVEPQVIPSHYRKRAATKDVQGD